MNESDISILNLSAPPGGAGEVELVAEGGGQPEVVDVAEGEVVRPGHRLVQRALLTLLKAGGESGRNKEREWKKGDTYRAGPLGGYSYLYLQKVCQIFWRKEILQPAPSGKLTTFVKNSNMHPIRLLLVDFETQNICFCLFILVGV